MHNINAGLALTPDFGSVMSKLKTSDFIHFFKAKSEVQIHDTSILHMKSIFETLDAMTKYIVVTRGGN